MKIGIIGASIKPFAWSRKAHLPALTALGDEFNIQSVSASSKASAEEANEIFKATNVCSSNIEVIRSDADIIVVSINVALHEVPCLESIAEKKNFICEWPLGKDLIETENIATKARAAGVRGFVMSQGHLHPVIRHVKKMIDEGMIGKVQSINVSGHSHVFARKAMIEYLEKQDSGGNMLTIAVGHTIHALRFLFGELESISARGKVMYKEKPLISDPTKIIACTAFNNIIATGEFITGALLSLHYKADDAHGPGLVWEILGDNGSRIKIEGDEMLVELTSLRVYASNGKEGYQQIIDIDNHYEETGGSQLNPEVDCVARFYYHVDKALKGEANLASTYNDALMSYRVVSAIGESIKNANKNIKLNT